MGMFDRAEYEADNATTKDETNTAPDTEFSLIVIRCTAKAILFTSDKNKLESFWLPKSQITMLKDDKEVKQVLSGDVVTVQLPRWLAEAREIVA